jgi:peptidylprolyl isomerase
VRRIVPALALAAAAALILTGCSGGSKSDASPKPSATSTASAACKLSSGTASDKVQATGDQTAAPKVTFDKGLSAKKEQRTVLIKGTGEKAVKGRTVNIGLSAYNATSGAQISDPFGYDKTQPVSLAVGGSDLIPGLTDAVECLPVGSRIAYVAPSSVAFGSEANATNNNLKSTDSVVFVVDVLSMQPKALAKANGTPQKPKDGFPAVTLAKSGKPTVTIPKKQTLDTSTTQLEVLKKGKGATVKDGDQVTVHYSGVLWRTGKVFDSSWSRNEPATFATNQVVKGFGKALVGQTVGSQVVAVVPPAEGYGTAGQGDIKGTDIMVFVVDILATSSDQ